MKSIKIAGFSKESIVDGEGYRYTIFVQGCLHRCPGCQNPETWDLSGGTEYNDEKLRKVLEEIVSDPILDGITLSGGDPFFQCEACTEFVKELKKLRKDLSVWAYTGFDWDTLIANKNRLALVKHCDVIVDGPFIKSEKTLDKLFRGSSNQRLIDVKKSLESGKVVTLKEV